MSSANSSRRSGNTRQISPSKYWVFTLNNYQDDDISSISAKCATSGCIHRLVYQREVGEEGTEHLQGYVEFINKKRPMSVFNFNSGFHWERRRGTAQEAIAYCTKADTRQGGKPFTYNLLLEEPLIIITALRPWQQEIVQVVEEDPHLRRIHWYWESVGNVGKTSLCRYLCHHHHALILSGKGTDIFHGIVKYKETMSAYPRVIIIDIPRSSLEYVSYAAIEKVKDGLFFSGKYEGCMVLMNAPHIICFANSEPQVEKMSMDRWAIKEIENYTGGGRGWVYNRP